MVICQRLEYNKVKEVVKQVKMYQNYKIEWPHEQIFLKSRQDHYQNVVKGEEVQGDYQGVNFLRINSVEKDMLKFKILDVQEWYRIPACCRDVVFPEVTIEGL